MQNLYEEIHAKQNGILEYRNELFFRHRPNSFWEQKESIIYFERILHYLHQFVNHVSLKRQKVRFPAIEAIPLERIVKSDKRCRVHQIVFINHSG